MSVVSCLTSTAVAGAAHAQPLAQLAQVQLAPDKGRQLALGWRLHGVIVYHTITVLNMLFLLLLLLLLLQVWWVTTSSRRVLFQGCC
jgi:hypothetical protein